MLRSVTCSIHSSIDASPADNHSGWPSQAPSTLQAGAHLFDLGCKWLALNLPLGSDKPKVLSNKYITMDTVFLPNIVKGAKKNRHFLIFNFWRAFASQKILSDQITPISGCFLNHLLRKTHVYSWQPLPIIGSRCEWEQTLFRILKTNPTIMKWNMIKIKESEFNCFAFSQFLISIFNILLQHMTHYNTTKGLDKMQASISRVFTTKYPITALFLF